MKNKSIIVDGETDKRIREMCNEQYGVYEFLEIKSCKHYYRKYYNFSLCIDNKSETRSDSIVKISFQENEKIYNDEIIFPSLQFIASTNISVDVHDNYLFIGYVIGNAEKQIPFFIIIKCIDTKTNQIVFHRTINTQSLINDFNIVYNYLTKSILVVYNDWTQSNSKNLYYGSISFSDLIKGEIQFSPEAIHTEDSSEKRSPKFHKTKQGIFLSHTTGDNWGFFSYSGKQGIGISFVNEKNILVNYRTLSNKNHINKEIIIENDTLYYQHVIGKNHGDFEIKKISLADLEK